MYRPIDQLHIDTTEDKRSQAPKAHRARKHFDAITVRPVLEGEWLYGIFAVEISMDEDEYHVRSSLPIDGRNHKLRAISIGLQMAIEGNCSFLFEFGGKRILVHPDGFE